MLFSDFTLHPKLLKAVTECGFDTPSDIQQQAIPHILDGRDIMASAPTGTGKTAAFVLPALQRLHDSERPQNHGPRVLVLTPTRELAKQVADNIYMFTKHLRMRSCSIVGGAPYPPQIRFLKQNLDLLVATPGRLIDHIEAGRIDFSNLELLILDEADRMLDMGFVDDVKRIAKLTPSTRQTLLFSATLEGEIRKVAQQVLKNPAQVQIAGNRFKHDAITQKLHQADDFKHKHALLSEVLADQDMNQAIIFTATKRGADQLAEKLKDAGHRCAALHGDMRQGQRRRTIEQLSSKRLKVLVATDVAARGLDIKGISHVVNFDLPMQAEDYIHRIGRTGRGGATGTAISLVGPQDWGYLSRIEKLIESKLDLSVIAGLEPKKPRPSGNSNKSDKGRRKPNIRFKKKGYSNRSAGSKSSGANYSRRKSREAA